MTIISVRMSVNQCRLKVDGGPGPHFHMRPLTFFPRPDPSTELLFSFPSSTSLTYCMPYSKQELRLAHVIDCN